MKTRKIFGLMFIVLAAIFTSCSDNDSVVAATGLDVTKDNESVTQLDFNQAEAQVMLGVNTNGEWTATVPEADTAWLKITPHAGPGWEYADSTATNTNNYIKVTVTGNDSEQRSSAITVTAGKYSKVITVNQKGIARDPGDNFMSAWQLRDSLHMGYNLGNTLESNPSGSWWDPSTKTVSDWETAWGQPVTTQEMIDSIVAKGFNIIRVPVTWGPHLDANNNIDEAWMNRVEEVVNYVLKDNAYCIINVMHDTGAGGAWLYADMDKYPEQTAKYQAIWRQIANRFKDYGDHLIFESFNEILDKNYSWSAPAPGSGAYTAINKLQQDFVNTVRATGGNNEYRNLAITTYAATGNKNSSNNGDPLAELQLPTDVHPSHIYLTIHSYDPYNFCNYNAGKNADGKEYDYNIYVWDSQCEEDVSTVINRVDARAAQLGIPYIFGEFGAIDNKKSMDERVKYANYVASQFKDHHTTGLWWMGLFDRNTMTWTEPRIVNALKTSFGF